MASLYLFLFPASSLVMAIIRKPAFLAAACVFFLVNFGRGEVTGIETAGHARFTVITPQLIRMEYAPDDKYIDEPSWFAVGRDARFTGYQVQRDAESLVIDTGVIKLTYQDNGKAFAADNVHAEIRKNAETVTWHPGLQTTGNLGGTNRTLDGVREALPISDGVISRDGWYLLDDSKSVLATRDWFEKRPNDQALDWYFFGYGLDYKAALKSLTAIGGPIPLPRKVTMGIWYSRYWPYSSDDYKHIVGEYHQHEFPLDMLVMDMDWHTDGWTGYTWNKKLIPDGPALLSWVHAQGLGVTLNDHPADGVQPKEECYTAFMQAMGADAATPLPFDAGDKKYLDTFYRFTHAPLIKEGVDFWWLDWQQYPQTRSLPELTNLALLNRYNYENTAVDGKRGQSFSRWAGWGDQRYPIHFSGDSNTGWPMLAFEVPYTSTAGNGGCFFWSHDIGGHMGGRNEESYTRWCQFGALSAALRSHSSRRGDTDRRPWTYPDWAENSMRISFQLRARLLPYIYSCAAAAVKESVPLLRPMYIDYPDQEAAYHNGQQFLLGDNLLVAPITMPGFGPNRVAWQHVWFPEGTWYQYFSGEKYEGPGNVIAAADINEFPLFVRGGVPLPEQSFVERPATAPLTHLVLRCFPGPEGKTGTSVLYEDDGISVGYEKGAFATTELSYSRSGKKVTVHIAATKGSYQGQPARRAYTLLLPDTQSGKVVSPEGAHLTYDAETLTNVVDLPETAITADVTLVVKAADADAGPLHQKAVERRQKPILAQDPHGLQTDLQNAVQAAHGRGLVAENQHPYLLGDDVQLIYYQGDGKQPEKGTLRYGTRTVEVSLKSGTPLDLSGLIEAVPPADLIAVPGEEKRLQPTLGTGGPVLSASLAPLQKALGNLAALAEPSASGPGAYALTDGGVVGAPGVGAHNWISRQVEGQGATPDWVELKWPGPVKVKRILLYGCANPDNQVLGGKLTFNDGSAIDVKDLPIDGKTPLELTFPEKEITSLKIELTEPGPQAKNPGLGEIAVFDR
ncbi:MAG TPA: TIM-barrel domain-containing protein [Candidatus Methylacidiphilales bacterium]